MILPDDLGKLGGAQPIGERAGGLRRTCLAGGWFEKVAHRPQI